MLFLLFQLDADRYALPARDVQEVLPLVSTKALPGAPAGIVGLANYRGQAVPVLDLAILALGRASARRVSTRLLIVNLSGAGERERLLGLIVEHATEMMAKEPADFHPPSVATTAARYLGPIAQDPRGMIQRIDVTALLTPELRAALYPENGDSGPRAAATPA
jgi:chemotaxis-related protein WspB